MKLRLGVSAGILSADPFLNTYSLTGSIGMFFGEYIGVNFLYSNVWAFHSSAFSTLYNASGYGADVNPIYSLYGGELLFNLMYGKMNLLGLGIVHFDLMLNAGVSRLITQNGPTIAPWVGIGEQLYLAKFMALNVNFRMMGYDENIVELYQKATLGQVIGNQINYVGVFSVGFDFLLF